MNEKVRELFLKYVTNEQLILLQKFAVEQSKTSEIDEKKILYDIFGDLVDGKKIEEILSAGTGWEHPVYEDINNRIKEQDEFLVNPFEVEEGVMECRCGSKLVISYTKQVRSCDEGTSVFATCVVCKSSWTQSG